MSRVIFLNRYFHPDLSATSQILSDLAFQLAASGRDVHVITSAQLYDDPAGRLARHDRTQGVSIRRVTTTRFGRAGLWGRSLDYLSFYIGTALALRKIVEPGDIIIAKTDPPLLSVIAMWAARRRGARLVNWLQDLYPEIAAQLGVPLLKGRLGRLLTRYRNRSLRAAAANVVIGHLMAERLVTYGIDRARIHVVPNWTDDRVIVPIAPAENPLRQAWALEGKFVVGYSGNLGRAHEFETIVGAAAQWRDHPQIVFLMIGGGFQFEALAHQVDQQGLSHLFRFMPYCDQSQLPYSIALPDVHWLSLRPELEGLMVPSKFYGIAAAGRPITAITAEHGEIAELVRTHGCGVVIAPGHSDALADALKRLSADPVKVADMGQRARAMLNAAFTRRRAFERWGAVLDGLGCDKVPIQPSS